MLGRHISKTGREKMRIAKIGKPVHEKSLENLEYGRKVVWQIRPRVKKAVCVDCGTELSKNRYTRCNNCKSKGALNQMFGRTGAEAARWIDGRSFDPYPAEFNQAKKEHIRKLDKYTCIGCGMTEEEHIIVTGKVLHVHHTDYDKENNSDTNLATTCAWCNVRANSNRKYWTEFYRNKIKMRQSAQVANAK